MITYPIMEYELTRDYKDYIAAKRTSGEEVTYFLKNTSCEYGIVGLTYDRSVLKEVDNNASIKDILKPWYKGLNTYKILSLIPTIPVVCYYMYKDMVPISGYSYIVLLGFILAPIDIVFKKPGKAWVYIGFISKSLADLYSYVVMPLQEVPQLTDILLVTPIVILLLIAASWHVKLLFRNIILTKHLKNQNN